MERQKARLLLISHGCHKPYSPATLTSYRFVEDAPPPYHKGALPAVTVLFAMYFSRQSMIDCLPVELLAHIFSLATHGEEDHSFSRYSPYRPAFDTASVKVPVAVSCVSRHWRNVAVNTAALWTSLCVTAEMIKEDGCGRSYLDTSFLELYLRRSRMYPLDILIDARDPDWDISVAEPRSPFPCGDDVYNPLFESSHMLESLNRLLPHIQRWRSLEILTDIWAPMFVALHHINPIIMSYGAPRLESLALSRCNEYVSYSPEFHPKSMKNASLFSSDKHHTPASTPAKNFNHPLPSLRYLKLQGVHVDWTGLGELLSQRANGSLTSLEMDYHSREVRPSLEEFYQILASSSRLETLTISGSGPAVTDFDDDVTLVQHECRPIFLPYLKKMTLGYRDMSECQTILELLCAPNVKTFGLEDVTHVADPQEVDVGPILAYLGTGHFGEFEQKKNLASGQSPCGVFPGIGTLSLSSVKAQQQPLNAFLNSLQNLRHLTLSNMDLEESIPSLVPSCLNANDRSIVCPCPRLEILTLSHVDPERVDQCHSMISFVDRARRSRGSSPLRALDIQTTPNWDEGEDEDEDMEGELEYCPGGVFNDPEFDHYYAGAASVLQHR